MNKTQSKIDDFQSSPIKNIDEFGLQVISKEFLANLKLQLIQKVKPSKSILQALKHSNKMNEKSKKNIEELNQKISDLILENQKLKKRIIDLQQIIKEKDNINNTLLYTSSLYRKQSQRIEQQKKQQNFQIEILKEKIRHLEEYKTIKEMRFSEIIQRQAQYVGQINLLKYKNQTLETNLKNLEESYQKIKIKYDTLIYEERIPKNKSENSQKFRDYVNQQDSFKSDASIEQMRQIQHLIVPKQNNFLLVSCTKAVDIDDTDPIPTYTQKQNKINSQSFNEIDLMLVEEVPKFKTNSLVGNSEKECQENVNTSIIVINVNSI